MSKPTIWWTCPSRGGRGYSAFPRRAKPADAIVSTSQWIAYERKCCPFFDFELEVAKDSGPVWLRISGDKGIKDFIRTEFELGDLE